MDTAFHATIMCVYIILLYKHICYSKEIVKVSESSIKSKNWYQCMDPSLSATSKSYLVFDYISRRLTIKSNQTDTVTGIVMPLTDVNG